jgi:hypothetical protein
MNLSLRKKKQEKGRIPSEPIFQHPAKALVVVAAQEDGRGIGRIRLGLITDASAESLHPYLFTA